MTAASTHELAHRRRILFTMLTALTFRYPSGREPALIPALRAWFSGWPGVGRITVGMARQGFDLQLTRYDSEGWRATFYPEGTGALADGGGRVRLRKGFSWVVESGRSPA